jgi:hypothetical protein
MSGFVSLAAVLIVAVLIFLVLFDQCTNELRTRGSWVQSCRARQILTAKQPLPEFSDQYAAPSG